MRPSLLITFLTLLFCTGSTLAADEDVDTNNTAAESAMDEAQESTEPAETDSTATPPIERIRVHPYPDAERHQSLIEYLQLHQRQQEVMTLVAEESSFYGLFLRERSGNPQGGILILHDLEQHGHWPTLVAPLREGLTEHGWTTLAIELPRPPKTIRPPRLMPSSIKENSDDEETSESEAMVTESVEPAKDTGLSETPQAEKSTIPMNANSNAQPPETMTSQVANTTFQTHMKARIEAGLAFLNARGQLNLVIIATGDSAIWAANYVQNRQQDNDNARGIALVMIDPREHASSPLRLTQVLDTLDIPILDMITADNKQSEWLIRDRLGAMKRKHIRGYQQIVLANTSIRDSSIHRRIRGWLKTNAGGTELPQ